MYKQLLKAAVHLKLKIFNNLVCSIKLHSKRKVIVTIIMAPNSCYIQQVKGILLSYKTLFHDLNGEGKQMFSTSRMFFKTYKSTSNLINEVPVKDIYDSSFILRVPEGIFRFSDAWNNFVDHFC